MRTYFMLGVLYFSLFSHTLKSSIFNNFNYFKDSPLGFAFCCIQVILQLCFRIRGEKRAQEATEERKEEKQT